MTEGGDQVQEAATKGASEISDPVVLAIRGSWQFSTIYRLLHEREDLWAGRYAHVRDATHRQLQGALDEIEAIARRIRERIE